MKLHELREKRTRIIKEMRSLSESPKGDNGDLSDDQQKRWDELKADHERVERDIQRQEFIDEADRQATGEPVENRDNPDFVRARQNFRIVPVLAAQAGLEPAVDIGPEREVMQELRTRKRFKGIPVPMEVFRNYAPQEIRTARRQMERRVLTSASGGTDLIAEDHLGNQFIDILRARIAVRGLGATVLNDLRGNVDIPRLTQSGTSGWVAENSALTPADHDTDSVELSPKHVGALTELSRNMLQQSSPDIEMLVRMDFADILAQALDKAAIRGGGSNEPQGIIYFTTISPKLISTVDVSGLKWSDIMSLADIVERENVIGTGWLSHPSAVRKMRSTVRIAQDDTGTDVDSIETLLLDSPNTLDDLPLVRTTNANNDGLGTSPVTYPLIYGRWSDLLIGFWSEFDLLVNPYESTAYSKGNVQVRAMLTADIDFRHFESFAVGTGIAALS